MLLEINMTQATTGLAIIGGEIYTPSYQSTRNIIVKDGKIESVNDDAFNRSKQPEIQVIDARGCTIIPGLIDTLVHGGGGCDTMTGRVEDLEKIARAHAAHGVTSLVLAISSASM